eukprot:CAMPEP_0197036436 /NCGR_PEP_ID=MMETSP1384-20130603/13937_1 /TAXON_ID=29189 /ORGANISM="Ammonia sp." /LENGTH=738 /DNA_ID=CAMNT_0042466615 /DNA_START=21 /DNA_END=2237 /DNA_ORIENTATION=+
MGNDNGGFHESDDEDEKKNGVMGNLAPFLDDDNSSNHSGSSQAKAQPQQPAENKPPVYLQDPSTEDADRNVIYQSQYAMNLYGVTDSGEFVHNAVKRIPNDNRVQKIKQLFKYKKKLGEGASGKVLLVEEKFGVKKKCALKELHRKHKVNAQLFLREVVILESLQHPNILELYGIYLDKSSYFIATAYYSGGEFFDRIIKIKKFSEKQALKYIVPILDAVYFMHDKAIVHRDLKPSNMVFDKKGKNGKLKIIDFGTSEIVIDDDLYTAERVGTILYAPPEWKKDRIGAHIKKGDLWSLGVIVYVLMVGRLPFGEWRHIESYNNDLWFPQKLKKKLSYQCINFILSLLERYPDKRLSAKAALKHPWVCEEAASQTTDDLGADLKHGLQSVRQEDKISRVIGKVHAGKVGLSDLDAEDKKLVYENVKKEGDVQRYMMMYQNNNNIYELQQAQLAQQMNHLIQGGAVGAATAAYHQPPIMNVSQPQSYYNQIAAYNQNKYHPPPAMGQGGIAKQPVVAQGKYPQVVPAPNLQTQPQQQAPRQPQYKRGPNGGFVFDPQIKQIFESINEFREQQTLEEHKSNHSQSYGAQQPNFNDFAAENDELDEEEYEQRLKKTMSSITSVLDEDQEIAELRDMLGDDYEELKTDIDAQKQKEQAHLQIAQSELEKERNKGNPLGIHSEEDEELDFDPRIVDSLMDLALGTKHACVRAVLATNSQGVNQAAEWLMDHQNDSGINEQVDVL